METQWASMLEQRMKTWLLLLNIHIISRLCSKKNGRARMIIEKPVSNIPSNMVPLWDIEEKVKMFPMFMDDEDETAQGLEESTFPRSQEPLPITTLVEESKKVKCLPENKNEYEEGELEKESKSRMESNGYYKEGRQEMR
ncbi:hypothetical protein M9H77_12111 [Catharanthus roseus]|uniref:Uncharacterized protein n=1 Tax=Catharanthus roseus TaxID=4058 RepID=A0ACC0BGK6_CATRO|nr:hypothetical protein M9H77_12111 [Catharanthus roseus]